MAARRRQGGRLALALAVSLAVHAGLFLTVMNVRAPMREEAGPSSSRPVEVMITRLESNAPAAAAHPAAPTGSGRRLLNPMEPSPLAQPTLQANSAAGARPPSQPGEIAQGNSSGGQPGPAPNGPQLTFDCPPPSGLSRPGAVRADPCAFRGAARDRLPESVARQARIESDKAAYYDRVLEARRAMREDWSKGNTPMFTCPFTFGGGKGVQQKTMRNSLRLGKLPCYIVPPEGPLDPEVFVEPPPPKHPLKPGEMKE